MSRSGVGAVLLACVAERDWSTASAGGSQLAAKVNPQALARSSAYHGVVGCVYHGLSQGPPAARQALQAHYLGAVATHVRATGELAALTAVLDSVAPTWFAVKGPVLAGTVYARPDLRSYSDLDVVVPPTRLGAVLAALEEFGAELVERNWLLLRQQMPSEILLRLPHGTLLDLHWDLLNGPALRRAFRWPMPELVERAQIVRLGAMSVRTLDGPDTMIHLGVHGCLSGGNRLVWLKDVERAIARYPSCWDDVVARSRSSGLGLPVGLTLVRAKAVLHAAVPDEVTQALVGTRAWPAIASAADRLSPVARSIGNRSLARMVSRSTRSDTGSSLSELADHLRGAARVRGFSRNPPLPDIDPDSAASFRFKAGTGADRHAFLDAVAADRA